MEKNKNHEVPGADHNTNKEAFRPLNLELNLVKQVDDENIKKDIKNNA